MRAYALQIDEMRPGARRNHAAQLRRLADELHAVSGVFRMTFTDEGTMTDEQKAAFVNSQTACMLVELEAMKAENAARAAGGDAPAYGVSAFHGLIDRYNLGHNAVMSVFNR
jgi:hypothetical protein